MRRLLDRLGHRVRSLVRGTAVDRELERELRFHLESQIEENVAAGMTRDDAHAATLRSFGPRVRAEEACRDARRITWLTSVGQDLRYSRRSLGRQPLLVVAAMLSIAVGLAANTIVFGLGTELLFTPPSASQPDRLVNIRLSHGSHVSYVHWRALDQSGALEEVGGYQIEQDVTLGLGGSLTTALPLIVTANYFELLDVPFAMGRRFSAEEALAERDPRLAVVSHGFWSRRLGGASDVLGRVVLINGNPYAIIGVLRADFRSVPGFGVVPELYLPLSKSLMPDLDDPYAAAVQLVGRLRPGQRLEEGRAAFATAVTRLPPRPGERPASLGQFSSLGGASEEFGGTTFFVVLLVVTGLVLAIACANVAGLLVARGTVRRRELAVRAALGASRRRLAQQLLADGFWLALGGTAVGLVVTAFVLTLVSRVELPVPVPIVLNPHIGGSLLWYALGLLAVTTVVSALVPALTVSRQSVTSALRTDQPQYGHRRITVRNLLVVGQMAVALILLTTAGLFIRNLALTHTLDPGFDMRRLLVAQVTFPPGRHSRETRLAALDTALTRLRALPGVQHAAFARGVPLTMRSGFTSVADLGIDGERGTVPAMYEENWVSPGYFATMGMRLLAGRDLAATDFAGSPAVAVVSHAFAERYLSGRDPVGVRLVLPGPPNTTGIPTLVVGVVSDGKHRTIGEPQRAALYSPYAQNMGRSGTMTQFLVRTSTDDPSTAVRPVSDALAAPDPSLAVDVQTMESALAFAFLPSRVGALLLGVSGGLGLLLALVGLYAAVAFAVSRRTAEIGIRRALGATGAAVIRLVLGDWAWLVLTGIGVGLTGAWFITRPLAQFLVDGLSATDPVSFVATPVLLAALSAAATLVPAMAALRVDPARVLRNE
jgi:predicted permease